MKRKGINTNALVICVTLLVILFSVMPVHCKEYFVSPAGQDTNIGTSTLPFKTISKANSVVTAGDVVTFLEGTYAGSISPLNDGQEGSEITYRSEKPLMVVLSGEKYDFAILLSNKKHIIIDGFHIKPEYGSWVSIKDSEDIIVQNCKMEENQWNSTGISIANSKLIRIVKNILSRSLYKINGIAFSSNGLAVSNCNNVIVEGNYFNRFAHSLADFSKSSNLVIRDNLFNAEWGRLFELFNCGPVLLENNLMIGNYRGSGSRDSGLKVFTSDGIVRCNVFMHNSDFVIHSICYKSGDDVFALKNTRIYNNSFADNASYVWHLKSYDNDLSTVSDNIWKNNIFFNNSKHGGDGLTFIIHSVDSNNFWYNNLVYGNKDSANVFKHYQAHSTFYTLVGMEKAFPTQFYKNVDLDPKFIGIASGIFSLSQDSPCIDAGDFLTTVVSSGSGRTIKVKDARWFYDGFGIDGEIGDLILLGSSKMEARVVNVNRENASITVDRDLSWNSGDTVSLQYNGSAPDLGAVEKDESVDDKFSMYSQVSSLLWKTPSLSQEALIYSSFEDSDKEQWGYQWWWDSYGITNAYTRDGTTFSSGKYSVKLLAVNLGTPLGASIRPRDWNIDTYPWIKFSYRIPTGVSIGARVEGFPTQVVSGAYQVVLGGTKSFIESLGGEKPKYQFIDDDKWHEITIDARIVKEMKSDVTFLYAFYFYNAETTTKGQMYWFDDFKILPNVASEKLSPVENLRITSSN